MTVRLRLIAVATALLLNIASAHGQATPASQDTTLPSVSTLTMMAAAIPSSDIDRSIDFYTRGLGLTSRGRMAMGTVIEAPLMLPGGGAYLLLQQPTAAGATLPARSALGRVILMVPDLPALEARLTSAGFKLRGPIREMAQYKVAIAHVDDPDGNPLELIQRLP